MWKSFNYAAEYNMMALQNYPYSASQGNCLYNAAKTTPVKTLGTEYVTPNNTL